MQLDHLLLPNGEIARDAIYITPTPIALDGLFFQVNRAGTAGSTPPTFTIRREKAHVFNLLHCVTSGKGTVTVRGETYHVAKGDLFLLPAYEAHTYQTDPNDPFGVTWVEFAGSNSAQICEHILDVKGPIQHEPVFSEVLDLCHQLFRCIHIRDLQSSQLLYQILIALCDSHTVISDLQLQKKQEILDYIDDHLDQGLTMPQVAQHFGYHPNYFSSLFSRITGEPFSHYLIYRRVIRACQMLTTTDMPIQTIASSLGFFDVSHFYRHFTQICGMAPARYRRENKGLIDYSDNAPV